MGMIRFPRGLKSALTSLLGSSGVLAGEVRYVTDEERLYLATSASTAERLVTVSDLGVRVVNAQTGTSYTLASTDKLVTLSNAAAIALTVPPNSSVPIPVNTQIDLAQLGAGQVTLVQGSGVTINSKSGNKKLTGQYSAATLVKVATDSWLLFGDLAA